MTDLTPVKANACRVCGKPGVIHNDREVVRQRTYCVAHWAEYTKARKRDHVEQVRQHKEQERRAAELAAQPVGWQHVAEKAKQTRPDVTRLTIHKQERRTVLQRGAYQREALLKHDWQPIARFFLNIGFRLYSERKGVLVLERRS